MHKVSVRGIVVSGIVVALSGQASMTGMTLVERLKVADFVGVVRISAIHPSPNADKPEAQRQNWFLQTAEAVVTDTIKGVNIPSQITIQFDNGQREQPPNVLYDADAEYLVFLAREFDGGYSTCGQGQYAIRGDAVGDWLGSASSVTLDSARDTITKLLPR